MSYKMAKREYLFQHFVFLSRKIVNGCTENGSISPGLLSELRTLIEAADKEGFHGAASLVTLWLSGNASLNFTWEFFSADTSA